MTATDLQALEKRIEALERKRLQVPKDTDVEDNIRRARHAVEVTHAIHSARWKWVPSTYYDWPLAQRAKILGAPTTHHLCKSLLMENKKQRSPKPGDDLSTNPRFMLIVIQYDATLDITKLMTAIRRLRPVAERLEESRFEFRLATPEDNDRITGYPNGAVTPFGLKDVTVPILLSASVVPLQYFWMGGGHINLKVGMAVQDFVTKCPNVRVMDLSVARDPNDDVDEE